MLVGDDCEACSPNGSKYSALLNYISDLRSRSRSESALGTAIPTYLPYVISPLRIIVSLNSAQLFGQAAQLLYALLGLPSAMYSGSLARRQLDRHLNSGRIPAAMSRLVECNTKSMTEAAGCGWEVYVEQCKTFSHTKT